MSNYCMQEYVDAQCMLKCQISSEPVTVTPLRDKNSNFTTFSTPKCSGGAI